MPSRFWCAEHVLGRALRHWCHPHIARLALLLSFLLCACSSERTADSNSEDVGTQLQPLLSCTDGDLTRSDDKCEGAWEYQERQWTQISDTTCSGGSYGTEAAKCDLFKNCSKFEFGYTLKTASPTATALHITQCKPTGSPCWKVWSCESALTAQRVKAKAAIPEQFKQLRDLVNVSLVNLTSDTHICHMKVEFPDPTTKRDASCGCETCMRRDKSECTLAQGYSYSVPVQSRAQVERPWAIEPRCTTADEIKPVAGKLSVVQTSDKVAALRTTWERGASVPATTLNLVPGRARLLLERHAEVMKPSDRAWASQFFSAQSLYDRRLGCEPVVETSAPSDCVDPAFSSLLAKCERLARAEHVQPASAWVQLDECIGLLEQTSSPSACGSAGMREQARNILKDLVRRSLTAMERTNAIAPTTDGYVPELARHLWQLDRWNKVQTASEALETCVPSEEVCNAKDDDCDGLTDEEVSNCTVPIVRAKHPSINVFGYFASTAEATALGWNVENEDAFRVHPTPQAGLTALYRCHRSQGSSYSFLTTRLDCDGRPSAVRQGPLGYVATEPKPGALPLYALEAPGSHGSTRWLQTLSAAERDAALETYRSKGVAAWVWVSNDTSRRWKAPDAHGELLEQVANLWQSARKARNVYKDLQDLFASSVVDGATLSTRLEESNLRAERLDQDMIFNAFALKTIPALKIENQEILPAVGLTTTPALTGSALLIVTADALSAFKDHLESVRAYHDIACRTASCDRASPTTQAQRWAILESIDRSGTTDGLKKRLDLDVNLPQAWRRTFQQVVDAQPTLVEAVVAATGQSAVPVAERRSIADVPVSSLGAAAVDLAAVARQGRLRRSAFGAVGFLDPTLSRRELRSIISAEGRDAIVQATKASVTALQSGLASFESQREQVVRMLLTQVGEAGAVEEIDDERNRLMREGDRQLDELRAFYRALSASEERYGEQTDALAKVQGVLDEGEFIPQGNTEHRSFRGYDGSRIFPAQPSTNVEAITAGFSAETAPIYNVPTGTMVSMAAQGEYSPLCAVRNYSVQIPHEDDSDGTLSVDPQPGTTVGPEGFVITREGSSAQCRSADSNHATSSILGGFGPVICGIGGIAATAEGGPPAGQSFDRACGAVASLGSWLFNTVEPVSGTNSSQTKTSVQFNGGLRLKDTPFRNLPAGSLLVVEMPKGETRFEKARDIHLVRSPASSFIIAEKDAGGGTTPAVDLYFVVNDGWRPQCQDIAPPNDNHHIDVQVRILKGANQVASQVLTKMGKVMKVIRDDRVKVAEQGAVLPNQLSAYRAQAVLELQQESGIDLTRVPAVIRSVFEAFLEHELSRLELAAHIRSQERAIDRTRTDLEALDNDRRRAEDRGRLAQLLPALRLRNLDQYMDGTDEAQLRWQAQLLNEQVAYELVPMLELWHPDVLATALTSPALIAARNAILNAAPGTDGTQLVDDVGVIASTLVNAYDGASTTHINEDRDRPRIGLSFGRPGVKFAPIGEPADADEQTHSGFPRAPENLSRQVWDAITSARGLVPSATACVSDSDCSSYVDLSDTACTEHGHCDGIGDAQCDMVAGRCIRELAKCNTTRNFCELGCGPDRACTSVGTVCDFVTERCVAAPTSVSVRIQPADVYLNGSTGGNLFCELTAPVVLRSGLVFATMSNDTSERREELNRLSRSGRAFAEVASENQLFALPEGEVSYRVLEPNWLRRLLPAFYATHDRVREAFIDHAPFGSGLGVVGLSAFGDLTLDFSALHGMRGLPGGDGIDLSSQPVSEAVLVMEVDAIARAGAMESWVSTCR